MFDSPRNLRCLHTYRDWLASSCSRAWQIRVKHLNPALSIPLDARTLGKTLLIHHEFHDPCSMTAATSLC